MTVKEFDENEKINVTESDTDVLISDEATEIEEDSETVCEEAVSETEEIIDEEEGSEETAEKSTEPVKKKRRINWNGAGTILMSFFSAFVMVLGICLVLYFIWGPARNEFHSDSTDTLFWAEAAMQGNGLINPEFKYAAVMPLGGNLFMQIWIPFFGVTMMTHTLGMTTFFAAFVLALIWLLHEMRFSIRWTGITVGGLLMLISSSWKLREIFWGHIIYYSLGMLFLMLGLSLVLHIYNLHDKPRTTGTMVRKVISLELLLVMFIFLCTNSTTAIALFALPIIGAIFCERFLDHSQPLKNRKTGLGAIMLAICGAGVAGGMVLGSVIAGGVTGSYADAYSRFFESDSWSEHLERLPMAFLYLLGLDVDTTQPIMSLHGVNIIILIATAIIIEAVPFIALCCYGKIKDTPTRMIIWCHMIVLAFILVGYTCGGLSTANWRLSPLIVTGFLSSTAFMRWIYHNGEMRRLGLLLLVPIGYFCFNSAINIASMPKDAYLENEYYLLGQFLKDNDLEYGYATFWNAGVITVQTDSECKVRNIKIDEEGAYIYYYQSNINWYGEQAGQDDYFLLMTDREKNALMESGSSILTRPYEELVYGDYTIWVFDSNIF